MGTQQLDNVTYFRSANRPHGHVQTVCFADLLQMWAVAVPMVQMAPQATMMGVQPPLAPMLGPSTHPPGVAKP